MKRKIGLALIAASAIPLLLLAEDKPKDKPKGKPHDKPAENFSLNYEKISFAKVPAGKKYVVMKNGRKVKEFTAGQKTTMTTDCAQIPCPKSFSDDVICWKCVERIKAK